MGALSNVQLFELQAHLQDAIISCTDRGLYQSSKWAAELLNSLPQKRNNSDVESEPDTPIDGPSRRTKAGMFSHGRQEEAPLEAKEYRRYLLAKTFFDCREYDRCAAVFLPSTKPHILASINQVSPTKAKQPHNKDNNISGSASQSRYANVSVGKLSQKALFLAVYAKYLGGEKRKDEESEMILGPADGGATVSKELTELISILGDWLDERESRKLNGGGWLEYLYGILLAKNKNEDLAKQFLLKSVHLYPFNWGAWQELSSLLNNADDLEGIIQHLPRNIMTFIFVVYTNQELGQSSGQVHEALDQVEVYFPHSAFLKSQRALLLYHSKDFEESVSLFNEIIQSEPYRLDSLDQYSNVLYVLDHRPRLAFLAQLAAQTDKFRPETCCIVGNYYSRNSEHEKAVMYFRRALTLDRNFLSAWTLMGHEYVEMKNTHAALESYRRAIDVNRKDYRAYHGLGLTYEMLEMHSYALFYHQRAAALRPFDAKTWQAVGACFARVGKLQNAIRAYKRALVAGSYCLDSGSAAGSFGEDGMTGLYGGALDPDALFQLASLYEREGNMDECAAYMELVLAQEEGPTKSSNLAEDSIDELLSSQLSTQTRHADGPSNTSIGQQGIGVTATTSRARMWLARWEFMNANYQRANELANELCQDGVEVEEAKALVRDIRSRMDREQGNRLQND